MQKAANSLSFTAQIKIIGVNPYVLLPKKVLTALFKQSSKDRGAIPVCGKLNGHKFIQTLVKYSGRWRLYLNTPMRKAAGIGVGDKAIVEIEFDPTDRTVKLHPKLSAAFKQNKNAKAVFDSLSPSRQKEIKRYINNLKSEETINKNVDRAIKFLLGNSSFVGREKL